MLPIIKFKEWCEKLMATVNAEYQCIDHLFLSVKEEHLVKKLKDTSGIILCANFPDAACSGEQDEESDIHDIYFFVLTKTAPGKFSTEGEMAEYAELQQIMLRLRNAIRDDLQCGCMGRVVGNAYKIEWEYQIFGGYNGLSVGFRLNDVKYD